MGFATGLLNAIFGLHPMKKLKGPRQVSLSLWLPPLVLLAGGYALWQAHQPQCEPCLVGAPCPPCRSSVQYFFAGITGGLLLLWLLWLVGMRSRGQRKQFE